jgi:hypothetical protein
MIFMGFTAYAGVKENYTNRKSINLKTSKVELSYGPVKTLGIIQSKNLIELSGIVSGGKNKDILWVHNDRDNLPYLYAINQKAQTVGIFNLNLFNEEGFMDGDWEDIARMPGEKKGDFYICIGDIGNNPMTPKVYKILLVPEKLVTTDKIQNISFKTIKFTFPDGYICNNEALLIDPVTKMIYIVSKKVKKDGKLLKSIHVWSIPAVTDYEKVYTVQLVMKSIPLIENNNLKVTGGDISADGKLLILITDKSIAYLWELDKDISMERNLSSTPVQIPLAKERGSEAICFSLDKTKLFTVYDGKKVNRPLNMYPLKK